MNSNRTNTGAWFAAGLMAVTLLVSGVSRAQSGRNAGTAAGGVMDNSMSRTDSTRASEQMETAYLRQTLGDPKEEAAYQAFHKASPQDPDKKIKLGNTFLAKYPTDRYSQAVYEEMAQTYYDKKDLTNFYTYSDKGLSLFPDDIHLLALTGWVIPRAYSHDDPEGEKKLDKAETYSKHALDTIGTMAKPGNATDQEFTQYKSDESAVAHSGLGMVYFRRERYEESVKELQTATAAQTKVDPTDLFILGADYENLGRYKEAADAFGRCAQLPSDMQDRCKQYAAAAQKQASQ